MSQYSIHAMKNIEVDVTPAELLADPLIEISDQSMNLIEAQALMQ